MARRGRKKAAAESPMKPTIDRDASDDVAQQLVKRQCALNHIEVERRISAIQALRAAEIDSCLSQMRLIRSYFSKEQQNTPALNFFKENLPNLCVTRNEKYETFDLNWNQTVKHGGRNIRDSIDSAAASQAVGSFQFSVDSARRKFEATNFCIPDYVRDDPLENQMTGASETYQTPRTTGGNLSFGMTPKTLRLPKKGEMLMSVRGSPLGVYKVENLDAIHESGVGSHDDASVEGSHL